MDYENPNKKALFGIMAIFVGFFLLWGLKAGVVALSPNSANSLTHNIGRNEVAAVNEVTSAGDNINSSTINNNSTLVGNQDQTTTTTTLKNSSNISNTNQIQNNSSSNTSLTVNDNQVASTKIIMGGDIMFDRGIRRLVLQDGYYSLLALAEPYFKSADISVVNLEGAITSNDSKTLLNSGYTTNILEFTFEPDSAQAIKEAGITAVSLANNHSGNFGKKGVDETKSWLNQSGVKYFGDPWNDLSSSLIIEKSGIKFAFVGYHEFNSGFDNILKSVKKLSEEGDFVIVMPHWGVEYSPHPPTIVKSQARALVAAGAKAIIGSHPHVVGEHEWISGVPVLYSIGNLLFDQYFATSTMSGELVELDISNTGGSPEISHVYTYATSMATKLGVTVDGERKELNK